MSLPKSLLLFVTFCLFCCQGSASSWRVDIPTSVGALEGSCVLIPCMFDYPRPKEKITQFTGIWVDNDGHIIYHPNERRTISRFHNRTNLLGDLGQKDCSLEIDPVRANDTGPFHFRIEMAKFDKYSYREKSVSITTTRDPGPVALAVKDEGVLDESVSVQCSVTHSCPQSPPHFSWTRSGHVQLQHQEIGGATWRATSTLSFQLRRADHNRELQCTVTYRGGRQQKAFQVLSVKYPPEIRNASSCYYEGHHIRCMCVAESNPPSEVQFLLKNTALGNTRTERYGLLTVVTMQTNVGLFSSVRCTANNTVGSADLVLSLPLSNIHIYLWAGFGAAVLVFVTVLIVVFARKCSGSKCESTSPKLKNDTELATAHYSAAIRKQPLHTHYPESFISDHTYGNTETFDPDADDALYMNVQ